MCALVDHKQHALTGSNDLVKESSKYSLAFFVCKCFDKSIWFKDLVSDINQYLRLFAFVNVLTNHMVLQLSISKWFTRWLANCWMWTGFIVSLIHSCSAWLLVSHNKTDMKVISVVGILMISGGTISAVSRLILLLVIYLIIRHSLFNVTSFDVNRLFAFKSPFRFLRKPINYSSSRVFRLVRDLWRK